MDLLAFFDIDNTLIQSSSGHRRVFHFGDAPQDMKAGREAGVVPIGVATGVFTARELTSAGAQKVIPDLKDVDGILQYVNSMKT